jgi:hypothetical protein
MSSENLPPVVISLQANPDADEAKEFFRQLGVCVASWAYVDRRLYEIFHHTTGLEQKQSVLFYHGDRAFGRRLDLVDRALKAELPQSEFIVGWRPMYEEAKALSYTRNIFVHQPAHRLGTARDGKPLDIYSIYIEPYQRILNENYSGLLGKDRLDIEDLKIHENRRSQLRIKTAGFRPSNGWPKVREKERGNIAVNRHLTAHSASPNHTSRKL